MLTVNMAGIGARGCYSPRYLSLDSPSLIRAWDQGKSFTFADQKGFTLVLVHGEAGFGLQFHFFLTKRYSLNGHSRFCGNNGVSIFYDDSDLRSTLVLCCQGDVILKHRYNGVIVADYFHSVCEDNGIVVLISKVMLVALVPSHVIKGPSVMVIFLGTVVMVSVSEVDKATEVLESLSIILMVLVRVEPTGILAGRSEITPVFLLIGTLLFELSKRIISA